MGAGNSVEESNISILNETVVKQVTKTIQTNNLSAMEKISPLMKDNTIITIECPGPGKNIVVKRYNQINMTRIVLSEEEIKSIVRCK